MELKSVIGRLQALSHRLLRRILLLGTPKVLILGVALLALTFILDYFLNLPRGVRGTLLALSVGALGWSIWRHLLVPLSQKPNIDQLALMAEAADPSLKDQIISSIQLERDLREGRAVESPELIRATVEDTARRFSHHDFSKAVDMGPCRRPLLAGAAALAAVGAFGFFAPAELSLWFQRQILLRDIPWPRVNELVVTIIDADRFGPTIEDDGRRIVLHVPERTPLQIQVTDRNGKLPDEAELVVQLSGEDEPQRIAMGRTQKNEYFQHIFPPLLRSLTFYAEGGDDTDERPLYEVQVDRAPRVTRFSADYEYPAYTGRENRRQPDNNISAPEGTRITMEFQVNMELTSFTLEMESLGSMVLQPSQDGAYRHSFVMAGQDFYSYRLQGENGVLAADTPRYVISSEVDQAPRVTVEMPGSTSILATPHATIPLRGVAVDDYGVTSLGIRWGENSAKLEDGSVAFDEKGLSTPLPSRQVAFFHGLELRQFQLPAREASADGTIPARAARAPEVGDRIAMRFFLTDNRATASEPNPHQSFSDYEYQVQLLSVEDLTRELGQRQVRLRSRVRDIANLVEARILETGNLIEQIRGDEGDGSAFQARIWTVEQDQQRITIELEASARQFMRVYDGYLWNRVEESALTERLISLLTQAYRSAENQNPALIYGEAVASVRSQIDEIQIMGRLTAILDLLIKTSAERSPEAQRRLKRAGLVGAKGDRLDQLDGALDTQKLLRDELIVLQEKLEAWEDYLDLIQGVKDLLELQRGIREGIERMTEKK